MIPDPLRPPPGAGTLGHLRAETAAVGVTRVVAIQTSTAYRWDNRFLADTCRDNAPWMVGVCTLDPEDPGAAGELRRMVERHNVRGLRSVPQPGGLDRPGVRALWDAAADLGVPVNALIRVDLADDLERLLARHPTLPVVLDHCMYPRGRDGLRGETICRVLALARYGNLHAKLTWLVDGSDRDFPFEDTWPLLRAVLRAYGPERCVWGSDFPCELWTPKATYAQHWRLFTEALGLTRREKELVLFQTPGRLWFAR